MNTNGRGRRAPANRRHWRGWSRRVVYVNGIRVRIPLIWLEYAEVARNYEAELRTS